MYAEERMIQDSYFLKYFKKLKDLTFSRGR